MTNACYLAIIWSNKISHHWTQKFKVTYETKSHINVNVIECLLQRKSIPWAHILYLFFLCPQVQRPHLPWPIHKNLLNPESDVGQIFHGHIRRYQFHSQNLSVVETWLQNEQYHLLEFQIWEQKSQQWTRVIARRLVKMGCLLEVL